jgi:pimeloyl-ACP methyl ester carboxylesterase
MNDPGPTEHIPAIPGIARVDGVEECSAVINGVRWRYQRCGSGPALLLIHGFMAYSFSWRFVIKELAQHYTVYAVDLPGAGFSAHSAALPATLASDAEHLLIFIDHLGIEQCDIVGTSRGGGATICLCGLVAQRGQAGRIGRVVLSAPINPWSRVEHRRVRFLRTWLGKVYVVELAPRFPIILRNFFTELYADRATIPPDSFAGYQTGLKVPGSYEHIWNISRSWMADLRHIEQMVPLAQSVPALILWGDRDPAVRPGSANDLHCRWPNSAVVMMQNTGHMPYEEVPSEFNRIVLDFLLRNTPPTEAQAEPQPAMAHAATEPLRS